MSQDRKPALIFFGALIALAVLRIVLGFVSLPLEVLPVVNGILAALFLGGPILALFFASAGKWTPSIALTYLVAGIAIQAGFTYLDRGVLGGQGAWAGVAKAIAQIGLPMWCVGLGALLATMVKERNILLPIALFLGFFDAFLVFAPVGFTQQMLQQAPQVFEGVAGSVPVVTAAPATGKASPGAFIGPADFLFMAMFFVALFRFEMKTRQTLLAIIPTLVAYLGLVLVLNVPLPALIPIGLVVLIVNWSEFRLTRDEWLSTGLIGVLGAGLLFWGLTRPRPAPVQELAAEPSIQAPGPNAEGSATTPVPTSPGQPL
jgi:hypothetical protein